MTDQPLPSRGAIVAAAVRLKVRKSATHILMHQDQYPEVIAEARAIDSRAAPHWRGQQIGPGSVPAANGKPSNPKDAAAFTRAPLDLVPAAFKAQTALALAEGAMKYGKWNWRAAGIRTSVYVAAIQRHLDKWFNGEEADPATGISHLAYASAGLAVLIDGLHQGNATDDRPPVQPDLPPLIDRDLPALIEALGHRFGHIRPHHHTAADAGAAARDAGK